MGYFKMLVKDFWELVVNINVSIVSYLLIVLAFIFAIIPIVLPILLIVLFVKYLF